MDSRQACFTRLAEAGYRQVVSYQPASHFCALQWRETIAFLGVALLLSVFYLWRIRRDLSRQRRNRHHGQPAPLVVRVPC